MKPLNEIFSNYLHISLLVSGFSSNFDVAVAGKDEFEASAEKLSK